LSTALVWLRRDLRIHDNPALRSALRDHNRVVPVFCFDERLIGGRHTSGPRTQFLLESLADLAKSLSDRGSGLVLRRGPPERELPALAAETAATAVYLSPDVSPFATRRDRRVRAALTRHGIDTHEEPGVFTIDDLAGLRTSTGGPYVVFSAFHRRWLEEPRREVHDAPRALPPLPNNLRRGRLPTLESLGLRQTVPHPSARGGERAARAAMSAFRRTAAARYDDARDDLGSDDSSRLSAYLHLGCISPRELESRLPKGAGGEAFRRQLCWRDFYAHVLLHHPRDARREHQERYRGAIRWSRSQRRFDAWRHGLTGFPLVDAGMRQLQAEGFMHNRARLVTGSFLTKHLGIDWRWGERWFMANLLDGDEASNNGNWQWIASVGVDPQPVFRRILSPERQQRRFDPDGSYVRHHVPELRGVPDRHLAAPALMAPELQRQCGCVIGRDYPPPIVEHATARREALARYAAAAAAQ
jgi:deoxyribodipyrimidine photo-lyase